MYTSHRTLGRRREIPPRHRGHAREVRRLRGDRELPLGQHRLRRLRAPAHFNHTTNDTTNTTYHDNSGGSSMELIIVEDNQSAVPSPPPLTVSFQNFMFIFAA